MDLSILVLPYILCVLFESFPRVKTIVHAQLVIQEPGILLWSMDPVSLEFNKVIEVFFTQNPRR